MSYLNFIGKSKIPPGYWNDLENLKHFMSFVAQQEGYKEIDDWYKCSRQILCKYGGGEIFRKVGNIVEILNKCYENVYVFLPWKFSQVPAGFWNAISNQKMYMDWLFKKLGYQTMEDWYKLNDKDLCRGIVAKYEESKINILKEIYPEYQWMFWKFNKARGYWDNIDNQRMYMDWLFKELGYQIMEDWYNVTQDDFYSNYGTTLLAKYESNYSVIKSLYSEYEWLPWKFKKSPQRFWDNIDNQRMYMDWLFKELGYSKMEDCYGFTIKIIQENLGQGLLNKYINSYHMILKTLYPECEWLPWKFNKAPNAFWESISNQRMYMDWLFKELGYSKMEDWYQITYYDFKNKYGSGLLFKNYGSTLFDKYSSYKDIFLSVYPEYNWDLSKFTNLKGEGILNTFLTEKYTNVIWGYREEWCRNPETDRYLPFDFCLPDFNIIIELDGHQHFEQVQNWSSPEENQERDIYKMKAANENGFSVIRLVWEDVYENKNEWQNELAQSIQKYDTPKNIYIGEIYDKNLGYD